MTRRMRTSYCQQNKQQSYKPLNDEVEFCVIISLSHLVVNVDFKKFEKENKQPTKSFNNDILWFHRIRQIILD